MALFYDWKTFIPPCFHHAIDRAPLPPSQLVVQVWSIFFFFIIVPYKHEYIANEMQMCCNAFESAVILPLSRFHIIISTL